MEKSSSPQTPRSRILSKLNCEVLDDDIAFEVRWAIAGESIVLQLVGKLDEREYMSFGLSGDDSRVQMIGGDVVVAWVDKNTLKGQAYDYYLADKAQCSGPSGSCPDVKFDEDAENVRLLNAAMVNGYSIVTYQRPLRASDQYDRPIHTNGSQAIIWGVGPLNQRNEVSFHSRYLKEDVLVDFARPPKWNCPQPEGETSTPSPQIAALENRRQTTTTTEEPEPETPSTIRSRNNERRRGGNRGTSRPAAQPDDSENSASKQKEQSQQPSRTRGGNRRGTTTTLAPPPTVRKVRDAWDIPAIQCYEPEDGVFYAQMGPTGGKRGYPAITGHVGWGISWYINGLLIPEIHVVRGKTYTFVVEGGDNPEVSAKYHPFYITDDPIGGYEYKTPQEREDVQIFAGVRKAKDGSEYPSGTGRLCHWTQTGDLDADDYESFGAYQRSLELKCDEGEPGVIQWTPDKDTPDTVYYQCFTHRHLGWKIHVHDNCDSQTAASELETTYIEAPNEQFSERELQGSPSQKVETRVNANFIHAVAKTVANSNNQLSYQSTVPESATDPIPVDQVAFVDRVEPQLSVESLIELSDGRTESHFPYQPPQVYVEPVLEQSSTKDSKPYAPLALAYTFQKPLQQELLSNEQKTYYTSSQPSTENVSSDITTGTPSTTTQINKVNHDFNQTYIAQPLVVKTIRLKRPINRPLHGVNMPVRYRNTLTHYKKPYFRPIRQKVNRHNVIPYVENTQIVLKPPQSPKIVLTLPIQSPGPINYPKISETVKRIEVSPPQASTEKEPLVKSKATPKFEESLTLPLAENQGFKPETIKIEGGFIPIVNPLAESRNDQENISLELKPESQIGVLKAEGEKFKKANNLKPIFSTEKSVGVKKIKRPLKQSIVKIILQTRSLKDSEIEPIAEGSDKVDSFYLPPPGQGLPNTGAKIPSNIDIEESIQGQLLASTPPTKVLTGDGSLTSADKLTTFDGKSVSSATLTAKIFDKSILPQRGTRPSDFLRTRPQFVPFKGELPPLSPDVLFDSSKNKNVGVLHRDLDTPPLPSKSDSTRLSRVTRDAHHTPEHTAQQISERNSSGLISNSLVTNILFCFVVLALYKYL